MQKLSINTQFLKLALCVFLAVAAWFFTSGPITLKNGLAAFVLIGALWVSQAIPIVATALLVPVMAVIFGLLSPKDALSSFANPIIFLFMGGFALASALSQQGLDRILAESAIKLSGGKKLNAVLMICVTAAFMSMWISNTATTAMMLPVALGLLRKAIEDKSQSVSTPSHAFILLALAYSASIGGIATIIGSPPNAIAAAETGLSFLDWMYFGVPLALVLLPIMLGTLYLTLRPDLTGSIEIEHTHVTWDKPKIITLGIFILTVVLWIFSAPLASFFNVKSDMDAMIALLAILLLMISKSVTWNQVEANGNWGVLLLFGGGITLSEIMKKSQASQFLANSILDLAQGIPAFVVLILIIAFVVLLTELVSNTASAALLIPIFTVISPQLDLSPQAIAAIIAIAASCAFMLPVATPPNAIVFATGHVSQNTMMRCGTWLNIVCIMVIFILSKFIHLG